MERFSFIFLIAGLLFFVLAFVVSGVLPMLPVSGMEVRSVELKVTAPALAPIAMEAPVPSPMAVPAAAPPTAARKVVSPVELMIRSWLPLTIALKVVASSMARVTSALESVTTSVASEPKVAPRAESKVIPSSVTLPLNTLAVSPLATVTLSIKVTRAAVSSWLKPD